MWEMVDFEPLNTNHLSLKCQSSYPFYNDYFPVDNTEFHKVHIISNWFNMNMTVSLEYFSRLPLTNSETTFQLFYAMKNCSRSESTWVPGNYWIKTIFKFIHVPITQKHRKFIIVYFKRIKDILQ